MYFFIVNPCAGNGRARKIFSAIERSKLYHELETDYVFTEYAGHGEKIVSEQKHDPTEITCIIVIGGDGTIHEVMNGIKDDTVPVAFIPGGSGNDFARGLNLNGNPSRIFEQIVESPESVPYWLGTYTLDEQTEKKFVNSCGFGFDAYITRTANKSFYKKIFSYFHLASLSYAIALIHVLFLFKPIDLDVRVDNKHKRLNNCWMVTVSNHPYYGGGMKIMPDARIQPGTFSVLILHSISRLKVLALFLTVFTGKHTQFKEVEIIQGSTLEIQANYPIFYQIDGQTGMCNNCLLSKELDSVVFVKPKK